MPPSTEPFDVAQDLADAPRIGGRQRPRDAATLILTRARPGGPEAYHVPYVPNFGTTLYSMAAIG